MHFEPFLLDQWLDQYPNPRFNLASSTGPVWTLRDLLALEDESLEPLLSTRLLYTEQRGTRELREAVAETEGVSADQVQIVTGSSEGLWMLFFYAAEPGANVILPFPCFTPTLSIPKSFGIETRTYHLTRAEGFRVDVNEICSLADANTKLILVNSPHNPTGTVMSAADTHKLHDFCADRGIQLVVDQVYHPVYHSGAVPTAADLPHATILGDASKALSLSGLRIGWLVDRDRKRLDQYAEAHAYLTITAGALNEPLAALALRQRHQIYARAQQTAAKNLALAKEFFAQHSDLFGWIDPQGGMTAFPWLKHEADSRPLAVMLAENGVLIAPGDCFGVPDHFRIGFTAIGDRLPEALEELGRLTTGALSNAMKAS
jgi:aspartate/methionine/tyrosine aminotransferase